MRKRTQFQEAAKEKTKQNDRNKPRKRPEKAKRTKTTETRKPLLKTYRGQAKSSER